MRRYQHWEEIEKYFGNSREEHAMGGNESFKSVGYEARILPGLFLDLRSNDDNKIHGSGRRVENASEGLTIQLENKRLLKLLHLHHYGCSTQYRKWTI